MAHLRGPFLWVSGSFLYVTAFGGRSRAGDESQYVSDVLGIVRAAAIDIRIGRAGQLTNDVRL